MTFYNWRKTYGGLMPSEMRRLKQIEDAHWFMSLDDARARCDDWRRDSNEVRPHSGIGNKPLASLVKSVSGTRPTLPE